MIIIPTIELQNGRCVSLNMGRLDEPVIWHVDPVETARSFARAGAEWMQVTDFDAISGTGNNDELVAEIIRVAGISVQLAGGFRTLERIESWLEKGAGRVVIGTLAARDPALVRRLARLYPDQIVLAVDVWQGHVMTEGWKSSSAFEPAAFIAEFSDCALAAVLVTDIDSDVAETDASLSLVTALAQGSKTPVIASGLVRTIDDVSRLSYVGNVSGAIVSRALFRKTIDLDEALAAAAPQHEETAEFL
ncbi:MAG: HisA/HisF-related TIM barrel protein [Paracoccaceae bacterium]